MALELPHDVVNVCLTFEAVAYEFGHGERGYFVIAYKRGFVSLSQSSGVIYALMGCTITRMKIMELVERG